MARAFDPINRPGKGLPKSLSELQAAVGGGIVADDLHYNSGAVAIVVDPDVYQSRVTSGGTQGNEVVQVPSAAVVGSRHLVTFEAEGDASDVVRVNGGAGVSLQQLGLQGETPGAVTNVDLDTPGEFVLLEYQGNDTWNIIYTDGATS